MTVEAAKISLTHQCILQQLIRHKNRRRRKSLRQYALVLQECSMPDSGRAAYTKAHNLFSLCAFVKKKIIFLPVFNRWAWAQGSHTSMLPCTINTVLGGKCCNTSHSLLHSSRSQLNSIISLYSIAYPLVGALPAWFLFALCHISCIAIAGYQSSPIPLF